MNSKLSQLLKDLTDEIEASAKTLTDVECVNRFIDLFDAGDNEKFDSAIVLKIEKKFGQAGFIALLEVVGACVRAGKIEAEQQIYGDSDSTIAAATVDDEGIGCLRFDVNDSQVAFRLRAD